MTVTAWEVSCEKPGPMCSVCGAWARYGTLMQDGAWLYRCLTHAVDTKGTRRLTDDERRRAVTVICYATDANAATTLAAHAGYLCGAAKPYVSTTSPVIENYAKARP